MPFNPGGFALYLICKVVIGQFAVIGHPGGVDLLALLAFLPSVISSFFTQNKLGEPGLPGPLP